MICMILSSQRGMVMRSTRGRVQSMSGINGERSIHITMFCFCSNSQRSPPVVIFPGMSFSRELVMGVCRLNPLALAALTKNG